MSFAGYPRNNLMNVPYRAPTMLLPTVSTNNANLHTNHIHQPPHHYNYINHALSMPQNALNYPYHLNPINPINPINPNPIPPENNVNKTNNKNLQITINNDHFNRNSNPTQQKTTTITPGLPPPSPPPILLFDNDNNNNDNNNNDNNSNSNNERIVTVEKQNVDNNNNNNNKKKHKSHSSHKHKNKHKHPKKKKKTSLFPRSYKDLLEDKLCTSKRKIIYLTKQAKIDLNHDIELAKSDVNAIIRHCNKIAVSEKLAVIYLIDSISQDIGGLFIELFAKHIVDIMKISYQCRVNR